MTERIAIIGAGMGGLASALSLSQRPNLEVSVFEAADSPGGKMGVAHHQGVRFDTGPSLLTLPHILDELLADRGYALAEELTLFQPDPVTRYRFPDGSSFEVHPSLEATGESIRQNLGDQSAREFQGFMSYARDIWEAASPYFIMGSAPTVLTPFSMGLKAIQAFRKIDSTSTMVGAIDQRISDPRLKSVLLRYATFNGSDPREAPATLNCITWVDMGLGGHGVVGGIYEIALALERLAADGGVRFHYGAPVRSIERRDGVFYLHLPDRQVSADRVIVNADVRHLVDDLWSHSTPRKLSNAPPRSTSGWNAVLKARRRPASRRAAHEVLFPDRPYIEEFGDLFDRHIPPTEPTVYLCAKEKAHRADGWTEHEPLFLMANAPPCTASSKPIDWIRYEEKVLARLRQSELIDEADQVIWRRSPEDLAARFPGSQGSLYGAASNSKFSAFQRPANSAPGIDGMYLASGSAHPGGGVPLCLQSGRQAATELLQDLPP